MLCFVLVNSNDGMRAAADVFPIPRIFLSERGQRKRGKYEHMDGWMGWDGMGGSGDSGSKVRTDGAVEGIDKVLRLARAEADVFPVELTQSSLFQSLEESEKREGIRTLEQFLSLLLFLSTPSLLFLSLLSPPHLLFCSIPSTSSPNYCCVSIFLLPFL